MDAAKKQVKSYEKIRKWISGRYIKNDTALRIGLCSGNWRIINASAEEFYII